jgi:hypothetical protein
MNVKPMHELKWKMDITEFKTFIDNQRVAEIKG